MIRVLAADLFQLVGVYHFQQGGGMKSRAIKWVLALVAIVPCMVICVVLIEDIGRSRGDSRERAEYEHGVRLPTSASAIQCRGDGWLRKTPVSGGAVSTMFEMTPADLPVFLAPLRVRSKTLPSMASGDPTVNGWNVWPQGSPTFIPGNRQYGGFRHSWSGPAVPVEMVSCDSPVGRWLHLEFWRLDSGMMLAKICTTFDD